MKRKSLFLFILLVMLAAACGPSPKARTKDFASYLPETIGVWELQPKKTVELLSSTVTSKGHITLQYEGPDDAWAYIVVETHPSADAAQVAIVSRERELRLRGIEFEADRAPQQATAQVAQDGRVRYALFQEQQITVEIDILAADAKTPVSDEDFGELLAFVRNAYARVLDE